MRTSAAVSTVAPRRVFHRESKLSSLTSVPPTPRSFATIHPKTTRTIRSTTHARKRIQKPAGRKSSCVSRPAVEPNRSREWTSGTAAAGGSVKGNVSSSGPSGGGGPFPPSITVSASPTLPPDPATGGDSEGRRTVGAVDGATAFGAAGGRGGSPAPIIRVSASANLPPGAAPGPGGGARG